MKINRILTKNRILILALSVLIAKTAFAADCPEIALDVSDGWSDGGYAYRIPVTTGIPADNRNSFRQSTLRLFENGLEVGPAHSNHPDIRNVGQGMFSHWSLPDGTVESLRFSSSDDTYPGTNGKSYSYCLTTTNPAAALTTTSSFHAPSPTSNLVVDVRDTGAMGNGSTDDTAAIQAAVDEVGGTGGTVLVSAGTYKINPAVSVKLKSNMTLKMESEAILKAIPNNLSVYNIVKIANASNVNVVGGTIWGERHQHSGTGGEHGMCISIRGGSNVYVEGTQVRECWGDGIYATGGATNVNIYSVVADDNRRQGMSIINVKGMVVRDSIFKNTNGTRPQAGIDIEPNAGDTVNNVQIYNSQSLNNQGSGILLWAGSGSITNVIIDGNTLTGNNHAISLNYTGGNTVRNNTIDDQYGIAFGSNSTGNTATGNTIKYSIFCINNGTGNTLSNNICTLK